MISDSGIRTCLHLRCRFVGEERGVHTQVEQSLFPGLLSIAYSAGRKLGGNLGARLFQSMLRSWGCSMRLVVYALTQTVS